MVQAYGLHYKKYTLQYIIKIFGRSLFYFFIPVYLLANGFSLVEVGIFYVLQEMITFCCSFFLFKNLQKFGVRDTTILATLAQIILVVVTYHFLTPHYWFLVLLAVLRGFHDGFYWGAFSVFIIHLSQKKKTGQFLGVFNFLTTLAQVFLAPLAGYILDHYDAFWLVFLSVVISVVSLLFLWNFSLPKLRGCEPISFRSSLANPYDRYILKISHLIELFTKTNEVIIPLYLYVLFDSYLLAGLALTFSKIGEGFYSYIIGVGSDRASRRKKFILFNIFGYILLLFLFVFFREQIFLYGVILLLSAFRLGSWVSVESGINKKILPKHHCAKKMLGRLGENVAGMFTGLLIILAGVHEFRFTFLLIVGYTFVVACFTVKKKFL